MRIGAPDHISQQPCHMTRCAWTKTRVVILTDRQLAGPPRKKKVRFGSFSEDFSASVFGTFAMVLGVRVRGGGSERDVHWCAREVRHARLARSRCWGCGLKRDVHWCA